MRILALADAHGQPEAVRRVVEASGCLDLVMASGDWRLDLEALSDELLSSGLIREDSMFFVPGNADSPMLSRLERAGKTRNLHGRIVEFKALRLAGFGGSSRSPFLTPFEWDEDECWEQISGLSNVDVFLSHAPPYDTRCDMTMGGLHVGSESIRKYVEVMKPRCLVCDHVHESSCIDKVGRSLVVNPGPCFRGKAAVLDVDEEVKASLVTVPLC